MPDLFLIPPAQPVYDRAALDGFFIASENIPDYAMGGTFAWPLVILSYIVVVIAGYVALGIAGTLDRGTEKSQRIKLFCGAFSMGAGIWAMHHIGMLSYNMNMPIDYDMTLTAIAMAVAVAFSALAFVIVRSSQLQPAVIFVAAPFLGFAICGMHYIGMHAMEMDAKLVYTPGLFAVSFLVATLASGAALYLIHQARFARDAKFYRILAALVVGVAVTGMHYIAMGASVFLPYADCRFGATQDQTGLAWSIGLITLLIVALAYLVKELDEAMSEVQERAAQLLQAQKMEAVGQLTGGIAHDFNNILAVMLGNLELVEKYLSPKAKSHPYLQTAKKSVHKASDLTQRLLSFSKKQSLQPVPTDINALIKSMLSFLGRALGVGIIIKTDFDREIPDILIDPAQFETALLNLALNSRDAMTQGGQLYVRTKFLTLNEADAQRRDLSPGEYVAITIRDTGAGMKEEILARATEPFFTTKEPGKASGMGLSMVFGFARQSGGQLVLESAPEQGTTVTLYLPARRKNAVYKRKAEHIGEDGDMPLGKETILIVDDEDKILDYMRLALGDLGYNVCTASRAEEALDTLNKRRDIEVMITDVLMPGALNGYKLAESVLKIHPNIGIIFISGYAPEQAPPNALTGREFVFLAKPYSLNDLARAIRAVLH